ncbi:MAG TPA: FxSxx-COOH system tetratricopeptide repeat protein [Ktedonobacteraceae bacterium]|nr:FxSxx-COOH system tetratricopeptide repeat protein [Ktedonobacteraceae bacterium]
MEPSEKHYFRKVAFGERLAQARTRLKLSQEALAEAVGTTARSISRWEHNQAIPQQYYRERLCEALQTTPEALFGESDAKQQEAEKLTPLWHVPYPRNPYFTGREDILYQLHERLHQEHQIALTQPQIMSGLGGIGKTQTALEYIYRFRDNYQTVLWVGAETLEILMSDYRMLAHLFQLPEKDSSDQILLREAIKRWFHSHTNWLLVFDNVEDMEQLHLMLPDARQGHILITTRSQIVGTLGFHIDLQKMEPEEGALFLLRRARLLPPDAALADAPPSLLAQANKLVELLDGLPLALDQAGAYIEETACSLPDYLERYATRRTILLSTRGTLSNHHPDSVTTTLALAVQQVEQKSPAAANLLRLCAFLYAEAIPEEFFIRTGEALSIQLQSISDDFFLLDEAIRELRRFSLLRREAETKTLSIHRLVQAVLKDEMNECDHKLWVERIIQTMLHIFPDYRNILSHEAHKQSGYQMHLPHVLSCTAHIRELKINSPEAAELLYRVAYYVQYLGNHALASSLLLQAFDIAQQVFGKEHITTAFYLHELGLISLGLGQYIRAEEYLLSALAIRKTIQGPDHLDTAETLEILANLYGRQGKFTQAISSAQQALVTKRQILGWDHHAIAPTLNALAIALMHKGQGLQAIELLQKAISISKKALGADHFAVAAFLKSLGHVYHFQNQYVPAFAFYQQALQIFEQKLGPYHPAISSVLVGLGNVSFELKQYHQAEAFYQKAVQLYEKHPAPDPYELAYALTSLGELFMAQNCLHLARPFLYRTLINLGESSLNENIDNQEVVRCLFIIADHLVKEGHLMLAQNRYRQALLKGENMLGLEHPYTAYCRGRLEAISVGAISEHEEFSWARLSRERSY